MPSYAKQQGASASGRKSAARPNPTAQGRGNEFLLARSMAGEAEKDRYTDVGGDHFAASAIDELSEAGVVSGYADGSFGAANAVNQAEALKILLGAFDRKIGDDGAGEWYTPYLDAGESLGLTVAGGDPAHVMSRGEIAHQVARLAGLSLRGLPSAPFTDVDESHPYYYAILAAHEAGILRGDGTGATVRPDAPVTRAELAVLAVRGRDAQPRIEHATVGDEAILDSVDEHLGPGARFLVKGLLDERDTIPSGGPYPSIWSGSSAGAVIGAEFLRGVTVTHERVVVWHMAGFMGGLFLEAETGLTFASGPLPEEGWASELTLGAEGKVLGLNVGGEISWEQDPDGPESLSVSGGIDVGGVGLSGTTGESSEGTVGLGSSVGLVEHIVKTTYDADMQFAP